MRRIISASFFVRRPPASSLPHARSLPCLLPLGARPFHSSPPIPAKATKGRKKSKEPVSPPQGFNMDMMARDWGKWEHGAKVDVTLPFKQGLEPDWLQEILKTADSNGVLEFSPRKVKEVHELDPVKHGLRYVYRRLRKEKILHDNLVRSWGKWNLVSSARPRNARHPKRLAP